MSEIKNIEETAKTDLEELKDFFLGLFCHIHAAQTKAPVDNINASIDAHPALSDEDKATIKAVVVNAEAQPSLPVAPPVATPEPAANPAGPNQPEAVAQQSV